MEAEIIVTWIVAVLGTVIGVGSFFHMRYIQANWSDAKAKVIGSTAKGSSGQNNSQHTSYFAQLSFTAKGKNYVVMGDSGRRKEWPIGTIVPLKYKPSNPNHILALGLWSRLIFSGGFAFFGIMCWLKIAGLVG